MQISLSPERARLYLCFFLIYFIWGSTYLAIRFAIISFPPFLMAGTRFTLAGLVLYGLMRLRGEPNPSPYQWKHLALVGSFLFVGGNGLVVWAEQFIESGLAALLVSTLPLWLIGLDWKWAGGPAPSVRAMTGIVLGLVGMFVLIDPVSITGSAIHVPGATVCILASALWAIGSIHSRRIKLPESIFMSAACQMLSGGVVLLVVGTLLGEWQHLGDNAIKPQAVAAWLYLVVFGSMVAISAYAWLLKNASATSVSTYAFVNPVVALILGWLIAGEALTWQTMLGAGIILLGVGLVIFRKPRSQVARA